MKHTIQGLPLSMVPFLWLTLSTSGQTSKLPPQATSEVLGKSSEDAKSEAFVASGKFARVLVIRLKNGQDLLRGLQDAVVQERIQNGVFMGAFGSLTSYHVHVVNNTTFPPRTFT